MFKIAVHHSHWSHAMRQALDATNNPPALIMAGLAPNLVNKMFTLSTLQIIYFSLLIPPAAYHCFVWARKTLWPIAKRLLRIE